MRLMLAALIATAAIAIVAAVFAIWPVVADAPREDDPSTQPVDRTQEIRCEGALSYREELTIASFPVISRTQRDLLDKAEREIDRYC